MWVDDTSEELVLEALKIAVENGAKRWVYVETILRDWMEKGYRTVDEVRAARLAFRKQRLNQRSTSSSTESSRTMRKPIRTEIVPDWLNMDYSQPEDDDFDIEQARRELEERLKNIKNHPERRSPWDEGNGGRLSHVTLPPAVRWEITAADSSTKRFGVRPFPVKQKPLATQGVGEWSIPGSNR